MIKLSHIYIIALLFICSPNVNAATIRYALVIGNNEGVDSDGTQPFAPLMHAESEAHALKNKLVGLSNFDSSSKRTRLLINATKQDVERAIQKIVQQKKRDEQLLGKVDSIFLLYFTGHGLQGRILLSDGPLYAKELAVLFNKVDADFAVGIFDACHSGSLSPKGIRPTPGLNLFRELPQEVLSAKGSIWYVSSGSNQPSYEDKKVGGVFTHFFIEGLTKANREGPGISLSNVWDYARNKTISYTAARNRQQTPQQYISNLKSSGPIFFSFPVQRSATLVLSKSLEGDFALSYADGQLTELISKKKGASKKIAIYPGKATLTYLNKGTVLPVEQFQLKKGETVVLKNTQDPGASLSVGEGRSTLWAKGISSTQTIEANAKRPGISLLGGMGYAFGYVNSALLYPQNTFSGTFRIDYGKFTAGLDAGFGFENRDYPAWGYTNNAFVTSARMGVAFNIGNTRLAANAMFTFANNWQTYDNGYERMGRMYKPGLHLGLLLPNTKPICVEVFTAAGAVRSKVAAIDGGIDWSFSISTGLALYFRLI